MKIRRSILFLTAIAALGIVLMLWYGKKPAATSPEISVTTNVAPHEEKSVNRPPTAATVARTNAPLVVAVPSASPAPQQSSSRKIQEMQGILSTYNDVPIDFYGKVEDQFGNPVAGAQIKASIRIISGGRQGTDWLTTTSDANGLFQFHGRGQDIGMMPSKNGYALASTETLFKYSRMEDHPFVSHANNPTVIKMYKLQGAEPLVNVDQQYKLHYTGAPISFDLVTGKIVPQGGDVRITVTRPPGAVSGSNPQDWSLKIEAVNGGLIDSGGQEAVTYAAPEGGYQPSETFNMSTSNNTWHQAVHQNFFLSSRSGQIYGKVGLSFHINADPDGFMNIMFGGVLNANGSRNLESDPTQ